MQLLQLRHAAEVPALRTTRTLDGAAGGARTPGWSTPSRRCVLAHAWRIASRVRNALMLVRGRPGDSLPTDLRELTGVARVLGYPPGAAGTLVDDYRRADPAGQDGGGAGVLPVTGAPQVTSRRRGRRRTRTCCATREFRGLVVAQVFSEWGDHIARVALASLVLARTDSAFFAVLAFVVSFVPAVFGSALLGVAADRLPRKVVLIACDLARAVVIGVLALMAVSSTPVWLLLLLLLVAETFTAPFEAAHRAVVPDVLTDPRDYLVGIGLMRVLYQVDQVVGILAGRCRDRAWWASGPGCCSTSSASLVSFGGSRVDAAVAAGQP